MSKMQEFERASGRVANDFKAIIADASQPILERTRQTAAAAHEYVRANPWGVVGIALVAGALAGYLAGRK